MAVTKASSARLETNPDVCLKQRQIILRGERADWSVAKAGFVQNQQCMNQSLRRVLISSKIEVTERKYDTGDIVNDFSRGKKSVSK